ncbi:hypothetical protein Ancab_017926 [Ancistrocladus abbreviatus]
MVSSDIMLETPLLETKLKESRTTRKTYKAITTPAQHRSSAVIIYAATQLQLRALQLNDLMLQRRRHHRPGIPTLPANRYEEVS